MVEAVGHSRPLHTSILNIYEVLQYLHVQWICMWVHLYCWCIAIDTLSTLGSLFSSIPPYHVVRDSGTWRDWQVMSPFAALPSAQQRSINHHRRGREREFIPIPPLPSASKNSLIPSIGLMGTPSSFIFSSAVPLYVWTGTNEWDTDSANTAARLDDSQRCCLSASSANAFSRAAARWGCIFANWIS
jgi:hypothetical protein